MGGGGGGADISVLRRAFRERTENRQGGNIVPHDPLRSHFLYFVSRNPRTMEFPDSISAIIPIVSA